MSWQDGLRVLLVDIGKGLTATLGPPLRSMGYEIRLVDRSKALTATRLVPPDVIILGLDPGHSDGAALIQEFHQQASWRNPLVVALIDSTDSDGGRRAREAGAHLALADPIDVAVLAGALRRFQDLLAGVERCNPPNG